MSALKPIIDELNGLKAALRRVPGISFATVEGVDGNSVYVLIDGAEDAVDASRFCACSATDRVICITFAGKCAVIGQLGASGGGGGGSIAHTTAMLKGDGSGGAVAASAGTDYVQPSSLAAVATSGDYDDLIDKPSLATVATTGAYADLTGKPTIPTPSSTTPAMDGTGAAGSSVDYSRADHVHPSDTSKADVSSLATVATSGDYNDLDNLPTIPSASAFGASIDVANRGQAPYDVRVRLLNSSGTELSSDSIPAASSTVMGVMTPSQYTKLDGIESGAQVNVQADWSEADSTSDAYIQNKPTIPAAGLPTGGSSGQVLAKASGTDYDVTWVNQSGGGGGSIASTNGLLAGDGSGNAIAADPASMFVLEQYVVINGVSTANGGVAENTVTESKAGYFPLCVAGWTSSNRYPNVYGCRLTAQSVGSVSIFCGASNFSGSTRTLTVSAVVLWVKVS